MSIKSALDSAAASESQRRILQVVAAIPAGQVMSYGGVARRAGFPRGARLAARALARSDGSLPWHRVLRADGRIAFPAGSAQFREQARRLRAEGVKLVRGRVQMDKEPVDLDVLLWAPSG